MAEILPTMRSLPHCCPYPFPSVLGLGVSLNSEVSDAFIPRNPALTPGSLPSSWSHPGPQGHTPRQPLSLHPPPATHRLHAGAQHLGETQLWAALVLWLPCSGHTGARPGGQLATGS